MKDLQKIELSPLDRLIVELRGPDAEKDWDFAYLDYCACGLARKMGIISPRHLTLCNAATALGIPKQSARILLAFADSGIDWKNKSPDELVRLAAPVRPRHVAAALEHYRDTGEALSPFHFVER